MFTQGIYQGTQLSAQFIQYHGEKLILFSKIIRSSYVTIERLEMLQIAFLVILSKRW